jgi:ribosomal protein S12 methylthiotransferase accessory factor
LLPVQLIFMRFGIAEELGEERIGYTTSNGLACGPTPEEAILAALLELLERDAFMIVWENRLSLALLDWDDDPRLRRHHERYFASSGLAVNTVDLSVFWDVPTVLGVVRNHGEGAVLGVGAAAAATVSEAWRAAVTEAFAVRSWARTELFEKPPRRFDDDLANVTDFADHVAYHGERAHTDAAAFLDRSTSRRSVHDVSSLPAGNVLDTIKALCGRLASRGLRAYAVDVSTTDLRQAGLYVFKAVVPELCALSAVHAARFLGSRRLYRAAHEIGLRERPVEPHELNPFPHPFP